METEGYFLLIPFIINILLVGFLLTRGDDAFHRVNRAFSLWVISICFWYSQLILETVTVHDSQLLIALFRISLVGEWVIPSFFVYFVMCFTNEKITFRRRLLIVVPAVFFASLIFIDCYVPKLVVNTIRFNVYGSSSKSVIYVMYTFIAWFAYFIVYISWGIGMLVGHILRTTVALYDRRWRNVIKQSDFLLATGGILIFILGLTIDIIIPIVSSRVFPISSITTLIMVGFVGYLLYRVETS
ncbi:MAG: hypothetical protein RBU23_07365 [Candidatus Auribacterota bacterium]|jgi:hypothetical protein|nr:hypothetical protein [Candidatus Auribacterota bacterium]